jgi:alkanesulfonate monooxygenase SsuD/methylene tetrahydromethanopterin reductase-like flavin-dependent oxidoreductase (luciferase family)
MGIEHRDRRGRMAEGIKAMRMLWADGRSTFRGEPFRFTDADIGPRPVNSKGPPIIVAADKVTTVARVPKLGADYWLPSARHSKPFLREALPAFKRSLEEVGRPFAGIPLQRDMCVAKDERAAQAIVEKSYERMLHMQSGWGQPGERYNLPFDELKEERVILGSPQKCAEELVAIHKEFGAEFVLFRIYTPGMDPKRALDMMEQVGKEVLPLVRREVGYESLFAAPRASA